MFLSKKRLCILAFVIQSSIAMANNENTYPFNNEELPIQTRVDDLVSRLTLEEKITQLFDKSPAIERLGIPRYEWWNEALHGIARAGEATVFPQAIGLAASFDEEMMLKVATAISTEGRAKHEDFLSRGTRSMYTGLNYWSPNINIFRDPRWGRGQETYGEDPYLTGRMAINFVNGLQGDDDTYLKTGATIKHYAVHSGPEPSRHSDNYDVNDYDLYSTYLPAFETVIKKTNVHSMMCAYNAVNGVPACVNDRLVNTILRDEFGFEGYIVSDCGAVADVYKEKAHHYTKTKAEAAALSVKSGVDLECGDQDGSVYSKLLTALKQNLITEKDIDASLKKLYNARFRLGLFDKEGMYKNVSMEEVGSAAHLSLALEAATKAIVLLDNDGTLPLSEDKKIALIGPNADNFDILIANYHGQPVSPYTPLRAFQHENGDNIIYAPGSALAGEVYTHHSLLTPNLFSHKTKNGTQTGVIVEYYNNTDFSGQPVKTETHTSINTKWKRSPISGVDDENYSVKYTGIITPKEDGLYEFDGTVSLTLNGQPVNSAIKLKKDTAYSFEAYLVVEDAWHSNAIEPKATLTWINKEQDLFNEALVAAKQADVVLFMGGISASLEGEEMQVDVEGFLGGDRTSLAIPAPQLKLLKALKQTNKPLVYVNFSGSALDLSWPKENANAVIQAFYPGEATGLALADIIYGKQNPSGRLPVTFYKSVDDLPDFKDYAMTNRTHRFFEGKPVYSFGAGKGYADIQTKITSTPKTLAQGEDLKIKVKLNNPDQISAQEVIQIYVEPTENQSPEKQALKYFTVVDVPAKTRFTEEITVPAEQLYFIQPDGSKSPYQGKVTFRIGADKNTTNRFNVKFK